MIDNVKHLKFVKKLISMNSRERGNVYIHNGQLIFSATVEVNGDYSMHYWTGTKDKLDYQGKLKVNCEGEDPSKKFYGGYFHLFYEDKDVEESSKFEIRHDIAYSIDGTFNLIERYTPKDTGISGCLAVYSPLADLMPQKFICDWRTVKGSSTVVPEENIGIANVINGKIGKLKPIILAKDYGYDSLGVGGSLHKIDGKYILETAGLVNYKKEGQGYVNGLMECPTLTRKWKVLNKILTNEKGERIWATFFKDNNKWWALASLRGSGDIYLAKIIEKSNGGNMKPQRLLFDGKVLSCDDIPTALRFDAYATGGFQYDLISSEFSRFNNRVNFLNIANKFIKGKGQEFWIVAEVYGIKYTSDRLKFGEPIDPEPEPSNNTEIISKIKVLLSEIKPQ